MGAIPTHLPKLSFGVARQGYLLGGGRVVPVNANLVLTLGVIAKETEREA